MHNFYNSTTLIIIINKHIINRLSCLIISADSVLGYMFAKYDENYVQQGMCMRICRFIGKWSYIFLLKDIHKQI